MIGFRLNTTKTFFAPERVMAATDRAARRVMNKWGGGVKIRMRRSIRRRKRASRPGEPPSAHAPGGSGLKYIRYSYNARRRSVLVGVVRNDSPRLYGQRQTVPELHELGGVVSVLGRDGRVRPGNYPKRPIAKPVFDEQYPRLPEMYRNAVRPR